MEEKIFALKPSFIQHLHQMWKENFSSSTHNKFIDHINDLYEGEKLDQYLLPGDNGLYIDSDVVHKINVETWPSTEWDYKASLTLYNGCGNGLGIYQKDENNNRIPLDMIYATDTRIWNYLSLFKLSKYTINRWGNSSDSKRIFVNKLSNEKTTRHAIMRLYWTANLCNDSNRADNLELLKILWHSADFMLQITERKQSNMRQHTQWFLDFCKVPVNNNNLFHEKSSEGYLKYRKLLKLYNAQDNIYMFVDTDQTKFNEILSNLLMAC